MTKGLIGIGMPIIAVPLLTWVADLPDHCEILSIPARHQHIPQALEGDKIGRSGASTPFGILGPGSRVVIGSICSLRERATPQPIGAAS